MIKVADINRIIVHKIHPKKAKDKKQKRSNLQDAYAEYSDKFLIVDKPIRIELLDRIERAIKKGNKFFKLEYEDVGFDTFYHHVSNLHSCSDLDFLDKTKKIADLLADSHHSPTIPGGLLLIMEGLTQTDQKFIITVKAEVQTAFTLSKDKQIELVQDLFLSPAKDFYKIGFFLEERNKGKSPPNDKVSCYMYDDHFNLQKGNLTSYFYKDFMGCTTDSNDRLKTNSFYQKTKKFLTKSKIHFTDQRGILKALDVLYREDTSGFIDPQKFASEIFPPGKHYNNFMKDVVEKDFPTSFTKDKSLLDRTFKLDRKKLSIGYQLELKGPETALDRVELVDNPEKMKTLIDSGKLGKKTRYVILHDDQND